MSVFLTSVLRVLPVRLDVCLSIFCPSLPYGFLARKRKE